ncbi:anti-sigma factor [Streptomyces sp. CC228A]|uniref:anti-sigma factor family protein n=1 Tax=Streptomyces sp. CC228A TaxID=2898186 RepID=UPI001F19DE86|nr:zf-HC2 domain-containing protein [Streptomyces sp. CC228A]
MTTPPGYGEGYTQGNDSLHDAVGAYVLGVLDPADASVFEAHLPGCALCTARLDELSGMPPMLAMLAQEAPPRTGPVPRLQATLMEPPAASPPPPALDRLLNEVTAQHARRRKRTRYMLAAAVAMIVAGPAVAVATMSGDGPRTTQAGQPQTGQADAAFDGVTEKLQSTDAATKVSATVGTEKKAWGTRTVLELKNVKGPLKCNLVAVSKSGEEEVVTSWAVPAWGYGIEDSPQEMARKPLYVHGGAAMDRNDIDHFEVRTFTGDRLVQIPA